MLNTARARRTRGISLVELMVGIAVGLIVLVGLSSVYVNAASGGRATATANQLNQELRALTDIMVNDLRRAGYTRDAAKGVVNPFMADTTLPRISNDLGCILYSYDRNDNGVADAGTDFFGFRLNGEGVVQMARSATLDKTATAGCLAADAWQDLTDRHAVRITKLTFTTTGSKCIAFDPVKYEPMNVANDPDIFVQWKTLSDPDNHPACTKEAPKDPPLVTYPPATRSFLETRQVNIEVAGQSIVDPTLKVELRETVLIRNNRVITP